MDSENCSCPPSQKRVQKRFLKGGSLSVWEGVFAKKNLRAGEDSAAALFSGRHDDALTIIHDHEAFSDGDCACRFRRIIVGCWLQLRANVTGACQFLQVAAGCARGGIQSRDGLARTMSWTLWRAAFVTAARARDYHKAARRNCCYWQ